MEETTTKIESKTDQEIPKKSHETLFGTLLLFVIILLLLLVLAGIVWGGYFGWREKKELTALPSIGSLAVVEMAPQVKEKEVVVNPEEKMVVKSDSEESVVQKSKSTDIQVLNGGAAKGSAGAAAELLKKSGFTRVTLGNTTGDYMGVTVYYAAGFDKEAEVVKKALTVSYSKAEAKPALKENKETSLGTLTVILGK